MNTKTIYFVRHGESTYNVNDLHQDGLVELSERGLEQAKFVAKRFLHIHVDSIIASPYTRAKQTAEVISAAINLPITFNELFVETRPPSEYISKAKDDPEVLAAQAKFKEHIDDPEWRYSDEENFNDRTARAKAALAFLESIPQTSVLVVSHGSFIRYMLIAMMLGDTLKPADSHIVRNFLLLSNTGITVCEYSLEKGWKLHHWNDVAHLS